MGVPKVYASSWLPDMAPCHPPVNVLQALRELNSFSAAHRILVLLRLGIRYQLLCQAGLASIFCLVADLIKVQQDREDGNV